jgi:hypothetical protein
MDLVPLPRRLTLKKGTVSLKDAWRLEAPAELATLECLEDLVFLKPEAKRTLALRMPRARCIGTMSRPSTKDEAYLLDCSPDRIELSAFTKTGIIRGIQTLRQLAREDAFGACVIEDEPALAIRGFHLDFRPKSYRLEYLLRTIDRLAELKYNFILLEWENKFPFARRPEVVHPEALTVDDIAELKARCAKYAIEIMPLVQTFGHLQFALCVPGNAHLREVPGDPSEICPLKDEAVELVKDLVRDLIDAHPESRYVHLGADEAFVMGTCPACKANCEKVGRSTHFISHMRKIVQVVLDAGKVPVMWNDMLIAHPEAVDLLPREIVMLDWHYHAFGMWTDEVAAWQHQGPFTAETLKDAPEVFKREFGSFVAGTHRSDPRKLRSFPYTRYFMEKGFDVIVGPSSCCWGDPGTSPNHATHVPNVWGSAASAALDGALGCILTSWEVRRHPWEVQWYLIALCAETAWNPHEGVRDDFDARFMRSEYGIDDATIPSAFYLLDRTDAEDRCDHYGRKFCEEDRRWCEPPIAEQLAENERKNELADKAPQTANAASLIAQATIAKRIFDAFAANAKRNALDATFWQLAAEETIFRVELFEVLREIYFARKTGGTERPEAGGTAEATTARELSSPLPPGESRVREPGGTPLDTQISRVLAAGDTLYARAQKLWSQLLPPRTLAEEMLTRWGEVREYLRGD